ISLLLRLDLEFLESTPKTLINSLHATARNFDTPSYWTLTLPYGSPPKSHKKRHKNTRITPGTKKASAIPNKCFPYLLLLNQ
ncbi:hypothetical protein, partial [Blautia sp. BCRC 81119]|uniref:hypothetical protein n=1 Tax=Blautia sp. BCRC 81119 TaxID=2212480 RepID=UPI001A9A2D77